MSGIDPKNVLLVLLVGFTLFYIGVLVRRVMRHNPADGTAVPTAGGLGIGFIANFFDTLGIGSFATTTAMFRKWKMVPDEHIPGTLNVGHTLPTIAQAFIFTKLVPVDAKTLLLMIAAAVVGSYIGAGIVAKWPRRNVQLGMGFALLGAAILLIMTVAKLFPAGGDLLRLDGLKLAIGMAGNFALGALMSIGIGLYAPCMILIYLLGMNPTAAFPIMMGSCAFLMPAASARFVKAESFNLRATLGLAIGGVPAVLLAAFVVKSLPLDYVRVLVVVVVLYTAYGLLRSAQQEKARAAA